MTGSLVPMEQAFGSHFVDDWHGSLVGLFRSTFFTSVDSIYNPLDEGTHHRAHGCIVLAALLALASALFGLC